MTGGEARRAVARALTLAPGLVPLGLLFGASAVKVGLSPGAAIAISALVFAGGAQFAAVGLVATGAALAAIAGTVLLINARYFLLSTATLEMGRKTGARGWQRVLLALGTVDESYALQAAWPEAASAAALLVIPATLWVLWVGSTALGAWLGDALPDLRPYGLDYALPGIFVGLLGIFADTRAKLAAGLVALALGGAAALLGFGAWAVLVVPTLMAFALGAWKRAG
ncbi:MAG: hypothetical protein QOE90_229 [Thermoplasmata archaeon]|nr:hypothetical protein [Thermoplasmata archaeon]